MAGASALRSYEPTVANVSPDRSTKVDPISAADSSMTRAAPSLAWRSLLLAALDERPPIAATLY